MNVSLASDEPSVLADHLVAHLMELGHTVTRHDEGTQPVDWVEVARRVAQSVTDGEAELGICLCWTGTGVSIAANRHPGIRAALCADAQTARGARRWNDANVLAMSNRLITPTVAEEILDAWLSTDPDPAELPVIRRLDQI